MQIISGVAIHTIHPALAEVDIPIQAFMLAQIFRSNPAAMAGGAVPRHGWGLLDNMTVNETAANRVRLADMTVPTGGMAGRAVVPEHLFQLWMIFRG